MRTRPTVVLAGILTALLGGLSALALLGRRAASAPAEGDWRADWAVEEGFALGTDTEGYRYPSAIAFVPDPGPGPKDPRYGQVWVTTVDSVVESVAVWMDSAVEVPGTGRRPARAAGGGAGGLPACRLSCGRS